MVNSSSKKRRMLRRSLPDRVELVVFDFDGVFTNNHVWVNENGRETVACDRGDGLGISLLREAGFQMAVLSTETNPVVSARCRKLKIECHQALEDKAKYLRDLVAKRQINMSRVIYVGNDLNDFDCMQAVGYSVAVHDAYPAIKKMADLILRSAGGRGAVREICELLLKHGRINNG